MSKNLKVQGCKSGSIQVLKSKYLPSFPYGCRRAIIVEVSCDYEQQIALQRRETKNIAKWKSDKLEWTKIEEDANQSANITSECGHTNADTSVSSVSQTFDQLFFGLSTEDVFSAGCIAIALHVILKL